MLAGLIVKFGSFWLVVSRPISTTFKSLLNHQWRLIKVIIGKSFANCHDRLYKTAKAKKFEIPKRVHVTGSYSLCKMGLLRLHSIHFILFRFTLFFFFHFWAFALAKFGGGNIMLGVYNVEIQFNSLIITLH